MSLFGNFIKRTLLANCLSAGILLTAQSSLVAAPTDAPAGAQPVIRPTPTVRPAQAPASGIAVGGLYGIMTDQQRASYGAAMREMRPKFVELETKKRAAQQELLDISLSTKFDENVIREKAMVVARIDTELTVLRVKAYSEMQPPLTADQIQKLKSGEGPSRPLPQRGTSNNPDANGLPPKH